MIQIHIQGFEKGQQIWFRFNIKVCETICIYLLENDCETFYEEN